MYSIDWSNDSMFPFLSLEIQQELDQLAQQYSQPLIRTVNIGPRASFDPLNKRDRYGEVCMVIRRKNGRLLTMVKTYYPKGAYRLLTGGINIGEPVFEALLRETNEETGLEVKVERFLAAIAYTSAETGETPAFYTFAFLLDEIGGTFGVIDEDEKVEDFREILPADLPAIAEHLQNLDTDFSPMIHGNWGDWGRFRSVVHTVVWEALQA